MANQQEISMNDNSDFEKEDERQRRMSATTEDDLAEHECPISATVLEDGTIVVNHYLDEENDVLLKGPSMQQIGEKYKLAFVVLTALFVIGVIAVVVALLVSKPWVDGEGL